jgi:hypothetical protein
MKDREMELKFDCKGGSGFEWIEIGSLEVFLKVKSLMAI